MSASSGLPRAHFADYAERLGGVLSGCDWELVEDLARELRSCWEDGRQVFICGNGGSAGNALHLANDFLYGVSKKLGSGLRVNALSANASVMTCLANDVGYEHIYSAQLAVQGRAGDVLIVFSGSGNSPNIIHALEHARAQGVKSYAILGYSGGEAKEIADVAIHFEINDMQISEDMQLILGHMIVQWLNKNQPN